MQGNPNSFAAVAPLPQRINAIEYKVFETIDDNSIPDHPHWVWNEETKEYEKVN